MRKKLLLFTALFALSAGPLWAGGLNLGWVNCPTGVGYTLTRTSLCSSNSGINTMVGSFVAPGGIDQMSANEVVIDLQTSGALLADWWRMGTGRCRPTALGYSFDFTGGPIDCYDYWQGGAIGALQEDPPGTNNRARIKGVFALPAGDSRITSVPVDLEVYSFKLNINNSKTAGLGACAGCNAEACIVLNEIKANQPPPLTTVSIANPAASAHVIWQAWTDPNPSNACPLVTPTRKQTWGSIKSLYR